MFGLNLTQLGLSALAGAVCLVAVFMAGNHYGPNASWRAHREAEDAAKNQAIEYLNDHENQIGLQEDKRFAAEDAEFKKVVPSLGPCVLNETEAAALNGVGD